MAEPYPNIPGARAPDGTSQNAAEAVKPCGSHLRSVAIRALDRLSAPTFSGFWRSRDRWGRPLAWEAYHRDEASDAFDLFACPTWWRAMLLATTMAEEIPGCEYEGGPVTWMPNLDRRAAR